VLDAEIDATEALLQFELDAARNTLIKVDVSFGVVSLWLSACALISSYYGMNLSNGHMQDSDLPLGPTVAPAPSPRACAQVAAEAQRPATDWRLTVLSAARRRAGTERHLAPSRADLVRRDRGAHRRHPALALALRPLPRLTPGGTYISGGCIRRLAHDYSTHKTLCCRVRCHRGGEWNSAAQRPIAGVLEGHRRSLKDTGDL